MAAQPSRMQCPECDTGNHAPYLDSGCRNCGSSLTPPDDDDAEQPIDHSSILVRAQEIVDETGQVVGAWAAARNEIYPPLPPDHISGTIEEEQKGEPPSLLVEGILAVVSGLIALFFLVQIVELGPCVGGDTYAERLDRLILAVALLIAGPLIVFEIATVRIGLKGHTRLERRLGWSLVALGIVLIVLPFARQFVASASHACTG